MSSVIFHFWRRVVLGSVILLLIASLLVRTIPGHATSAPSDALDWARPATTTIERISPLESSQTTPVMFNNTDCSLTTYHLTTSSTMQTGCFTETAFGLMDSDSGTVIFNGTDEGVRIQTNGNYETLLPWPGALNVLDVASQVTNGSTLRMYRNPLAVMVDHRDLLGRIDYKQLTAAPDLSLTDVDGKQLVINPQTLTYSPNGAWVVAEATNGWFVRINLASLEVTRFAPSFTAAGVLSLPSYDAVSRDGRYVAIANASSDTLKVYDLSGCTAAPCPNFDYKPNIRQKVTGLTSLSHVRFINDSVLTFQARSSDSATSGTYVFSPSGSIPHLTEYIGLGDSYTSGEGAFDYLAGTDTDDNLCHLSRNSYPLLLTHDLFSAAGGHSVACSGAVVNDVGSASQQYRGQVRNGFTLKQLETEQPDLLASIKTNYVPGYISQHIFVRDKLPRIATVSVGGDDIGFGSIVENCVAPHLTSHVSDSTCFNTYEDRVELTNSIDRMVPRWTSLYRQLLTDSPGVRLYAIGYPQIVDDTGNCAVNVLLSKSELEFSMEAIDYLDAQIKKAAQTAGVDYIDISQALKGHRLCEAPGYDVAVNGLTAGNDGSVLGVKVFGHESYHPNALGQELIEQAIIGATNHFASAPSTSALGAASAILNVPKSGRTINTVIRTGITSQKSVPSGQTMTIHIPGPETGLPANSAFAVHIGGISGQVVSQMVSTSDGTVEGTVLIPVGTTPGDVSLDLTGRASDGLPLDITQQLEITDNSGDQDNDGVPDSTDACPFVQNSGLDDDQDGIDDVCDGYVGSAPPSSPPSVPAEASPVPGSSSQESGSAPQSSDVIQPSAPVTVFQPTEVMPPSTAAINSSAVEAQSRAIGSLITAGSVMAAGTLSVGVSVSPATPPLAKHIAAAGNVLGVQTSKALPVIQPARVAPVRSVAKFRKDPLRTISWQYVAHLLVISPFIFLLLGWIVDRFTARREQ